MNKENIATAPVTPKSRTLMDILCMGDDIDSELSDMEPPRFLSFEQ